MTEDFVSLREVDLKKFEGRVLTLLGDISAQLTILSRHMNEAFHVPNEDTAEDWDE